MAKKKQKAFQAGKNQLILISFVILCAFGAVCAFVDLKLLWICLAFAVFEGLSIILWERFGKKSLGLEKGEKLLDDNMSLDLLTDFCEGVAVLDRQGRILWYNQCFLETVGENQVVYNTELNSLLDSKVPMSKFYDYRFDKKKVEVFTKTGRFGVVPYVFGHKDEYYITVWYDQKEFDELVYNTNIKKPIIGYISVDNYSEASGSMQNNYRAVTAKIFVLLKEWAQSLDAVIHEVERDRYILFMEAGKIEGITATKFDILDKVREISTDNVDIPVTISIGCANIEGSLVDKEAAAHRALDLALQRGGDQAVLKTANATEFYGGRTKTVQKRTKIRSRIIAGELVGLMKSASNVLIMGHKYADHDSIGSCVGIARLAGEHCAKVNVVVHKEDVNLKLIFKKLHGLEFYRELFIDAQTAQDLITPSTLLVICDVNNVKCFEAPYLYENCATTVIIDHHRKTEEFAIQPRICYIEPSASSASELVSEILEQAIKPGTLLKEEAELLFAGMLLDTKQFSRNTGVRTFSAALYLRGEGASPGEAQLLFRTQLDEFSREIKFENNITTYRGIFAIAVCEGEADQEDKIAASKAADRLLSIDGVRASFALCQIDGTVHVSARSSGKVNVQLIVEKLNGGGYFDAAGAQMRNVTMTQALTMLKKAIDDYADEK